MQRPQPAIPSAFPAVPSLSSNASLPYYALSADSSAPIYMARLGSEVIDLRSVTGLPMAIYGMTSSSCGDGGLLLYKNPGLVLPAPDTVSNT